MQDRFKKKSLLVLYSVLLQEKLVEFGDLAKFLKGDLTKKQIYKALDFLEEKKAIIKIKGSRKKGSWSILKIKVNPTKRNMDKVKYLMGENWNPSWGKLFHADKS